MQDTQGKALDGCAITKVQNTTFSGRIQRVWEDGFQLDTGSRSINVDSDDICGDHTAHHISESQQVTVSGEFDGGEFDAFSIQDTQGKALCR
ncbi:hypothetical protein NIES208_04030 [[Limnothrix rosea] IAM M-220]|nr:hypothetical protein NIES208_04030 [[Limnothrix rosea] IAM M-220]